MEASSPRPPAPLADAARQQDARQRGRAYQTANAVSYVLNPLVLPPVAFALLDAHFGAGLGEVALTFGISLVFFCLVPLGYAAWMIRSGRTTTLEVREQEQRWSLFLVGIASYVAGALLLAWTVEGPALPIIVAFASLFPINTAALLVINRWSKISVHMTSLSGFVGVLLFTTLTVWRDLPADVEAALTLATVGPLALLVPLLMWARVRVGAHTVGQVFAGAAIGLVVLPLQLWWIVYVWLDLVG
ncbi:MAG: hypothetical protein AAGK21_08165 [Bacteroidota bacterium]